MVESLRLTKPTSRTIGTLRHFGYTAANAFMDEFVQEHNHKSKYQRTSVNLDTWLTDQTAQPFYGGIPAEEGGNAINTILNMPQVQDVYKRQEQWSKLDANSSMYDLAVHVFDNNECLKLKIEYCTALFNLAAVCSLNFPFVS